MSETQKVINKNGLQRAKENRKGGNEGDQELLGKPREKEKNRQAQMMESKYSKLGVTEQIGVCETKTPFDWFGKYVGDLAKNEMVGEDETIVEDEGNELQVFALPVLEKAEPDQKSTIISIKR